nr:DUF2802 domain-containing protein [Oleiagrimonas sp. C23AA]
MLVTTLSRVEQRLARIEESQQQAPVQGSVSSQDKSYELAQRLARQGATAAQIVDACGIGMTEAELILRMHTR